VEVSARTILMASAVAVLSSAPAHAQDASRDRAELDAAAGRRVFANVQLADPNAFSRRARVTPAQALAMLERPAASGEVSSDREEFDAAAGRTVHPSTGPARAEHASVRSGRPVRVILPSPFGR
jgi:hypothetical protein